MNDISTIPHWDNLPALSWREKIAYLTYKFLQFPQTDCPIKHIFEGRLYIREITIPAQTLFLGRAHTYGHECLLLSGSLIHISPDGTKRTLEAPFSMHTTPGYHMAFYTVTEVIGRTIHPNLTEWLDPQALEADIFEPLDNLKALGAELHEKEFAALLGAACHAEAFAI